MEEDFSVLLAERACMATVYKGGDGDGDGQCKFDSFFFWFESVGFTLLHAALWAIAATPPFP